MVVFQFIYCSWNDSQLSFLYRIHAWVLTLRKSNQQTKVQIWKRFEYPQIMKVNQNMAFYVIGISYSFQCPGMFLI